MEQPKIKNNIILSTAYQIVTLITPFITAPYISRVLGAEGVGIYSYTNSIQMYFSMFAALGTLTYGAREIARNRDNKQKRSKLFWEIEILTIITSSICLIVWGVWITWNNALKVYYLILTLNLVATIFDISWFYTGLEQFKYIVIQNCACKVLSIVAIFILVNEQNDVAIYIAIMSLTVLLGNLSMWIYLPKFIQQVSKKDMHILMHFKETAVYFIPTIATSVYTVLDKTLIGSITQNASENGYYEQATKIINMAKSVTFSALNNVLGSRIAYLFVEEKYEEIRQKIEHSMDYIFCIGLGICFGIIGTADRFVPWFFGTGYSKVITLLKIFSPIVVIIGVSNCLGMQYYTPAGLRGLSAKFIIAGSAVNLVLNLILIPRYWSYGAVVASVIAEIVIMILYLRFCNGYIQARKLFMLIWKKLVAGAAMLIIISCVGKYIASDFYAVLAQAVIGICIYVLVLAVLKDSFFTKAYEMAINFLKTKSERRG